MESNSGVLLCLKAFRKIVGYDGSVILPAAAGGEKALFTSPLNGKKISFKFGDSEALKAIYRLLSHTLCARVLTNGFGPFYMTIKQKKTKNCR